MKNEFDPRVIKTKANLRTALIELMVDNSLEAISVQQLTRQAEVTRGAFYLHYKNKADFIDRTFQEIEQEFFKRVILVADDEDGHWVYRSGGAFELFSLNEAFDYFDEHRKLFIVLFQGEARNAFMEVVFKRMTSLLTKFQETSRRLNRKTVENLPEVPAEIAQAYIIYALLGVIQQWLHDGVKYTAHYMTDCCDTLNRLFNNQFPYVDFFVTSKRG